MPEITITLNGEPRTLVSGSSLQDLIRSFSLPGQRVAIELNRSVVRRQDWDSTLVKEGDRIEVVHFVGGG